MFVDDDVLLGKKHINQLLSFCHFTNEYFNLNDVVMEGILNITNWKPSVFDIPTSHYSEKELIKGERGFTHNTLIPKKLIEKWKPAVFTSAFEDYLITQFILKNNGIWIRFQQSAKSYHIRDYGMIKRVLWGTAGERIVKRMSKKIIIKRTINHLKRAFLQPFILKDVSYFIYNLKIAGASLVGYFNYQKYIELEK